MGYKWVQNESGGVFFFLQRCFNKEGKLVFTWFAFQFSIVTVKRGAV